MRNGDEKRRAPAPARIAGAGLRGLLLAMSLASAAAVPLVAQEHDHGHEAVGAPSAEELGKVHFETSCSPSVASKFDRADALLHSFWFPVAIEGFQDVLKDDPGCAIAYWGIALADWGNPFGGMRTPKILAEGWETVQKGLADSPKTEREKDYLSAVGELYKDAPKADQRTRQLAYEKAMEKLAAKYSTDTEAQIFYALALDQTALPTDKTYANLLKAAVILEKQFAEQPDHPGVAHYLIHTYDVPALAPRALPAARRYAGIAPSAPHALHMPSHTFTRVGYWDDSIATNIKSADAARRADSPGEELHAMDYMTYAYLQTAQDKAAGRVVEKTLASARTSGRGDSYGPAGSFASTAIPARYAIEREDWAAAKGLAVHPTPGGPFVEAMTHFVRALGFARTGDAPSANTEIADLARLRDQEAGMKDVYWTEQIEIERLAASAWAALAEGKNDDALSLMRKASEKEDATEKSAVTPGPLKPAREQFGELLLELKQPARALAEFETTLTKEPRRFRAVYGAAHAAKLAGDNAKAKSYYAQLVEICKHADTDRPELVEARKAAGQAATAAAVKR